MAVYVICNVAAEALLIFCGAFFASTETAYTSLSKITVRQMLKDNEHNAQKVHALRSNLDRLISTVLIGTNFVTTLISSLATAFSVNMFGAKYVSYATALVSMLLIMFSEIIPKTYAASNPKGVAQKRAGIIMVLQKIFFPVVWIFGQLSAFINFLEKKIVKKHPPLITEEELKTLLEVGEHEGTLEENERDMLNRIFEFSDLHVRDIMRHRSLVKYVSVDASLEEVVQLFAQSGYSRLPVYEDSVENIVGVLHYKSVLFALKAITDSKDFVRICMDQVDFVPGTLSAIELLQRFKKEKENFAVVVNEYGGNSGIVTMDDILRGVLGRITDEYGEGDVSPEKRITVISTNEFIVPGDMKTDDLNEVLNINIESDNFFTLGGCLLERLGELPNIGAVYKENGVVYIVEDQSSRRIQTVRIKLL
ncbi:MAG: HlyC/CorC family transporter [Treponema sp.]|nr:HlyC/CorC family transporter [Treponema sp.]